MRYKLALGFALPGVALIAAGALGDGAKPTYEQDMKPLFTKYTCVDCHNPEKLKKSKYDVTTYTATLKNVKAGDVDKSKLVKMIADGKMPPKKASKKVADEDLELIKTWVKAGALEK